ncbi:MAG TPA: hypothetical protein DD827_00785 [Gammaproteobacteria bacterium]|jgi:glycosyltransferase involved in cell wall biosynthesis|nr:hypothetical protein [Gammaproteobacteria bacterium]
MKVVHLHELSSKQIQNSDDWRWLEPDLDASIDWLHIFNSDFPAIDKWTGHAGIIRVLMTLVAARKMRGSDLIVTHGIHLAASVGFVKRIFRIKTQHLAWAFSVVNPTAISPLKRWYYRFSLRDVHQFVMFSSIEINTYSELLNLSESRFRMLLWSTDRPVVYDQLPPPFEPGYIAAIGGEGRDYSTLFDALRLLPDVRLVVVATPASVTGLIPPPNVELLTNMPAVYTFRIAHHSKFMIIPTLKGDGPCGHSTIVFQYLLGKATIVAESEAMTDYVEPGVTALTYQAGNTAALVESIQTLLTDQTLAKKLSDNGKVFAKQYCTEEVTVNFVKTYLEDSGLIDSSDSTRLAQAQS